MEDLNLVLLLLAVASVAALVFYVRSASKPNEKLNLPPGPPGLPVLGNLGIFVTSRFPHQELDKLSKKYGPIMSLNMGSRRAILVSSPKIAKQVLHTQDTNFASRPHVTSKDALLYGEDSIGLAAYGPRWRFMRKIMTLELLTMRRVQQFQAVRVEEVSCMVRWIMDDLNKASKFGQLAVVNMEQKSMFLLLSIMSRILMGKRLFSYRAYSDREEKNQAMELTKVVKETFRLSGVAIIGDYIPGLGFLDRINNYEGQMRDLHQRMDLLLGEVIDQHRHKQENDSEKKDYVDVLLSCPGITETMIKGLTMGSFNAGTDSSRIIIEWGLTELIRHPHILARVHEELDSVVGRERLVTEADLPHLPYFLAVVKEVFRLHPVAPLLVPHLSIEPCEVAGYHIPAQTTVLVNVWSIGRDPDLWEQPLEFLPDRFLHSDIDVRGKHFELLPFGTGRRGCPAMNLAITIVQYALARLLHSFNWSLPDGQRPEDLDMSEKYGLSLPKAKPLLATPTPRLPSQLY